MMPEHVVRRLILEEVRNLNNSGGGHASSSGTSSASTAYASKSRRVAIRRVVSWTLGGALMAVFWKMAQ